MGDRERARHYRISAEIYLERMYGAVLRNDRDAYLFNRDRHERAVEAAEALDPSPGTGD